MTTDDAAPGALPQWERKRARCKCAKIHTHAAAAAFVLTHVGRGGTNRSTVRLARCVARSRARCVCQSSPVGSNHNRGFLLDRRRSTLASNAFSFVVCGSLCTKNTHRQPPCRKMTLPGRHKPPRKKKGINRTGREAVAAAKPRCLRKVAGLPSSHMTRPSHSQRNHPGYGCLRACLGGQRAGTARHWACPPIASTASTATGPPKRDDDNDDDASSSSHARIRARASPLTSKMLPGERQSFFLRLQKM